MSDLSRDLASLRIDRGSEAKNPGGRKLPGWVVALIVVLVLAGAVAVAGPRVASRFFKQEVELTEIALVSPAQGAIDLSSSGYVIPQTVAKVGSKVIGRVAKVNIKEGGKVRIYKVAFRHVVPVTVAPGPICSLPALYADPPPVTVAVSPGNVAKPTSPDPTSTDASAEPIRCTWLTAFASLAALVVSISGLIADDPTSKAYSAPDPRIVRPVQPTRRL